MTNTFEQALDEWRTVGRRLSTGDVGIVAVQRKYLVATGPVRYAPEDPPIDRNWNEVPYVPVPGQPLWWFPVKPVWRDVNRIMEDELAAERVEDKDVTPKISTT